jgi:hypothetical protein
MLSYKDLSEHYIASEDRRLAHWRRLQDAAATLTQALEVSLMLESPTWVDARGLEQRYVSLGAVCAGKFEALQPCALLGMDDMTLTFAILLRMQRAPHAIPKQSFVVPLELRQWDPLFEVEIVDSSRPKFVVPVSSSLGGYADAAEGIKKWIALSLKQRDAPLQQWC